MQILQIKNKTYIQQFIWLVPVGASEDYRFVILQAGETRQLILEEVQEMEIRDRSPEYQFKVQDRYRMSLHFELIYN